MVTEADPSGLGNDIYGPSRLYARGASIVASGLTPFAFQFYPFSLGGELAICLWLVSSAIASLATLNYLRLLTHRLPAPSLTPVATVLTTSLAIFWFFLAVMGVLTFMSRAGDTAAFGIILMMCSIFPAILGICLFWIGTYIYMLGILALRLLAEERFALEQ